MSIVIEQAAVTAEVEPDLATRIASGDKAAEQEFIRRYSYGVDSLLRRRCRPGDPVVEDLGQEVLMAVLQRLRVGGIRDAVALPAYVQAAVVYAASAEYRRRRTMEPLHASEDLIDHECPMRRLCARERSAALASVLADMPVVRDREILVRFYLAEEGKDEVCRTLGIDDAHFHRVIFRARARFRELLHSSGINDI